MTTPWYDRLDTVRGRIKARGGDLEGYLARYGRGREAEARQYWEEDSAALYRAQVAEQARLANRTPWHKLPPVRYGYTRICDDPQTGGRRVTCDTCGKEISSLGIGYHRQNTGH
jgi:hypothetical protein